MDIKEIQNLIRFVSKSDVSEVKYKTKDFEITIRTNQGLIPGNSIVVSSATNPLEKSLIPQDTTSTNVASSEAEKQEENNSNYITIKSPIIGTFYRKPSPDKDYFVNVGDIISVGTVVCVVEAMKLFNEIESEVSGRIVKILAEDASPVEFDQPLFLVEPL